MLQKEDRWQYIFADNAINEVSVRFFDIDG